MIGFRTTLLLAVLGLVQACEPGEGWPTAAEAPIVAGELTGRTAPGEPPVSYFVYEPKRGGDGAPLLLCVHGISRNAAEHAHGFLAAAERYGVVLGLPLFHDPPFSDYQRLGRRKKGARADRAIERLAAEIGRATGARSDVFYLFGHSGGAQFVHRFALAHAERVAAVVASSAGWYTFPDPSRAFPDGVQESDALPGVDFDAAAFLRVPILVTVGELDTVRDDSLRHNARLDQRQGRTRVERAMLWSEAMNREAAARELPAPVTLVEVPGVGHDFAAHLEHGDLAARVFRFLFEEASASVTPRRAAAPDCTGGGMLPSGCRGTAVSDTRGPLQATYR